MSVSQPPVTGDSAPRSGPQGTQLLSVAQLQRFSHDQDAILDGHASTREPVLQGCSGALAGRRFTLHAGRQTVGRRTDNDIVIEDPSVSAAHAWIINHDRHHMILNTLSTNGTFVNDKRVHEATLRHGDTVRLGQVEFLFLTRDPGFPRLGPMRWVAMAVLGIVVAGGLAWWLY
jgi:hypothetical protein